MLQTYNNVKWKPPSPSPFAYKRGYTSGNQRPVTNNDLTLNTYYRHGLPRPLKWQFRKASNPNYDNESDPNIPASRQSHSQRNQQLLSEMIDQPGRFSVVDMSREVDADTAIFVESSAHKSPYLSETPRGNCCASTSLCCNKERNARRRVMPASTILKKNYFTTLESYRQNRCMTYDQKIFNFYTDINITDTNKPGAPGTSSTEYVGKCYPMMCNDGKGGCPIVVYKPSNYKYAKQGGVSSALRTYDLAVTTTKAAGFFQAAAMNGNTQNFPYVLKNNLKEKG